jgi:hypothetical protein
MALAADHQMVMNRNSQSFGGLADLLRHLDVVARRLGIATGMVVHERNKGRAMLSLLANFRL